MKRTTFLLSIILLFSIKLTAYSYTNVPYLTEIMANPEGSDGENEWIEIYNPSSQDINIEDWKIQNSNKEVKLKKTIIPANSYEIIKAKDIKLTIKNSKETISLINKTNVVVSKVEIEKAPEKNSFSLVKIRNGKLEKLTWIEDSASPREKNNEFIEIDGEISSEIKISKNFEIEINKKKILVEDNFDFNSLRALLKTGDKIKALIKIENSNYYLKKIKLIPGEKIYEKKNRYQFYYLLIPIFLIFIYLIIEASFYKSSHYKSTE